MDHIIGRRKIKAGAASFEADKEQVTLARLKSRHALRPRLRSDAAIEILIAHAARIERRAHLFEMAKKLAENECFMTVAQQLVCELQERGQLGAFKVRLGVDQRRMAAQAAKLADFRQDMNFPLSSWTIESCDVLHRTLAHRFVKGALILRQLHRDGLLCARRQLAQDGAFCAAQDEGPDQRSKRVACGGFPVALDGTGETALEVFARAEQAGVDGVEQAPKLVEIVLDGSAAESDTEFGFELLAGLRAFGAGVLEFCASSSTSTFQARLVSASSS